MGFYYFPPTAVCLCNSHRYHTDVNPTHLLSGKKGSLSAQPDFDSKIILKKSHAPRNRHRKIQNEFAIRETKWKNTPRRKKQFFLYIFSTSLSPRVEWACLSSECRHSPHTIIAPLPTYKCCLSFRNYNCANGAELCSLPSVALSN